MPQARSYRFDQCSQRPRTGGLIFDCPEIPAKAGGFGGDTSAARLNPASETRVVGSCVTIRLLGEEIGQAPVFAAIAIDICVSISETIQSMQRPVHLRRRRVWAETQG